MKSPVRLVKVQKPAWMTAEEWATELMSRKIYVVAAMAVMLCGLLAAFFAFGGHAGILFSSLVLLQITINRRESSPPQRGSAVGQYGRYRASSVVMYACMAVAFWSGWEVATYVGGWAIWLFWSAAGLLVVSLWRSHVRLQAWKRYQAGQGLTFLAAVAKCDVVSSDEELRTDRAEGDARKHRAGQRTG